MPPVDVEPLEGLCLIEERLVHLEMFLFDGLLREEKFRPRGIAVLELLCEDLVDGEGAAMVLYLLGNTVE